MRGRVLTLLLAYPTMAAGIAALVLGIDSHNTILLRLGIGGFAIACILVLRLCFTFLAPVAAASDGMVQGAVKFAILSAWPLVGAVAIITLASTVLVWIGSV